MCVDGGNRKDGVLAHVGVAVLQTLSGGGEERLNELGFSELAQEAKSVSPDVLVGVLQVVSDTVADQDHFLLQLAIGVELGANLVVKVQQLLQSLVLRGHDESNDVHEQVGHGIAIEHDRENALHGLDFALVGALLELRAQVREGGDVGGIVLVHQAVRIFQKRGHRGGCGVMLLARCRRCG